MEQFDVVCVGEALVDFLPDARGRRVRDVTTWTPHLGGAPANVAVGVSRLGGKSALVAVTGNDEFGHLLVERLQQEGVDTSAMRQTEEGKTGIGFVSLTQQGERSFMFYRQRPAESFLGREDTRRAGEVLKRARILHVGTNSLLQEEARLAMLALVEKAARRGQLVSCDPNLRLHLWPKPSVLKELLGQLLPRCAVVKLSEEEIAFVTGTTDVDEALSRLERQGVLLAVVTLGAAGAALRRDGLTVRVPAPRARVVDTTGAGDGFMSGLLFALSHLAEDRRALARLTAAQIVEAGRLGCLVGARVVQKLGAVAGLPRASAPGLSAALRRVTRPARK